MNNQLSKTDIEQIGKNLSLNGLQLFIFEMLLSNGNQSPANIASNLQSLYGDEAPSRGTLFSALTALTDSGLVNKFGKAPHVQYSVNEVKVAQSYLSIDYLRRSSKEFDFSFFEDYKPNISRLLPVEFSEKLRKISDATIKEGDTINNIVFSNLLIDFAFSSSKMEGNTYSILDTKKLLESGEKAEGKTEEESQMILNHANAMRYLIENSKDIDIDAIEIRSIHALLSRNLLNNKDQEGGIRKGIVFIGGTTYQPLSGELILAEQLELFCDKARKIEDPYECSMFILSGISYLQAFNDVNKRTARLLASLPLLKNNLCPISFFDADNDSYVKSLIAFYEINSASLLSDFFAVSYEKSALRYSHYLAVVNHNKQRPGIVVCAEKIVRDYLLHISSGGIYTGDAKLFFNKSFSTSSKEQYDGVLVVFLSCVKNILNDDFFSIMKRYELTAKQVRCALSNLGVSEVDVDAVISKTRVDTLASLNIELNQQINDLYQKKMNVGLNDDEQHDYDQTVELSNHIQKALSKSLSIEQK